MGYFYCEHQTVPKIPQQSLILPRSTSFMLTSWQQPAWPRAQGKVTTGTASAARQTASVSIFILLIALV